MALKALLGSGRFRSGSRAMNDEFISIKIRSDVPRIPIRERKQAVERCIQIELVDKPSIGPVASSGGQSLEF